MKGQPRFHFLGIRHHGPGCARNLKLYLESARPDKILVEAPENVQKLLDQTDISDFVPPVSILLFKEGEPGNTFVLPFARFSPEWVAIRYAKEHNIPIEAIDLPLGVSIAYPEEKQTGEVGFPLKDTSAAFAYLSRLQQIDDVEQWWEINFERTTSCTDHFRKIEEVIDAIRPAIDEGSTPHTRAREAFMRLKIRANIKQGIYQNIAVITGAAHLPYVRDYDLYKLSNDKAICKITARNNLKCNWIPWSYQRLSSLNDYASGVEYPLYYEHIFDYGSSAPITITAALSINLRKRGYDISLAHTLESVNLAQTLANMRGWDLPGIDTIIEACIAVYNLDQKSNIESLVKEAFIGNQLGMVPVDLNNQALISDFESRLKQLKLQKYTRDSAEHEVVLDLRDSRQLEASRLIWRLKLLDIHWGMESDPFKSVKGTFNEYWILTWHSEFLILLFHQCIYGASIETAAAVRTKKQLAENNNAASFFHLLKPVVNAQIDDLTEAFLSRIENTVFRPEDTGHWLKLIPQMAALCKYGSVRSLNLVHVRDLIEILVSRLMINLETVLHEVPEEEADDFLDLLMGMHRALMQLEDDTILDIWIRNLSGLSALYHIPALFRGWMTGISLERKIISQHQAFEKLSFELSDLENIETGAAWLQGILHSQVFSAFEVPDIVKILDQWLSNIELEQFRKILPGLRKSFSQMTLPLRESFRMQSGRQKPALDNENDAASIDPELFRLLTPYLNTF